jgi:uncharacterized surface protein with fasciclin (FAS1) repeats
MVQMKKRKYAVGYSLLLAGCWLLLLTSCKKQQEARNSPQTTLLQYIAQAPDLTLLNAAIQRCELDTLFSSGGPFTIFAPVDSAFIALGLNKDTLSSYDPVKLSHLLKYHILSGKFSSTDLTGFLTEQATSYDTLKPYLTKNYYGLFFNGIQTFGTTELGDGVVQRLNELTFPPAQTLLQIVDSLPELSYFAAVLNNSPDMLALFDTWYPTIPSNLQNHPEAVPGFTCLVPTNDAFLAFGQYPTIASIQQEQPINLMAIFAPYGINGFKFTSDFMGGFYPAYGNVTNPYEFPGGTSVWVVGIDGLTIYPNNSQQFPTGTINPRIIKGNIVGSNGIIHEIDQIFL